MRNEIGSRVRYGEALMPTIRKNTLLTALRSLHGVLP